MLSNPWVSLPDQPPFILDEDKPYVDAFNQLDKRKGDHRINLDHTPEPRLGPIDAPVIILQLNPSYAVCEAGGAKDLNRQKENLRSIRDEHAPHLGVTMKDLWWAPRLRSLIENAGEEKAAKGICSVEFFPYRSRTFAHGHIRLPSQDYTFGLVRSFIERKATFVVTRNFELWAAAVPELRQGLGRTVFVTRNPRRAFLTCANLPPDVYDRVVSDIKRHA